MSDTREIFRLRKAGEVDQAYALAKEAMAGPATDDWDLRALSWCLVDLLKRAARQNDRASLSTFSSELEAMPLPEGDDILEKQRRFALSLAQEGRHEILSARNHSKAGHYAKACQIYRDLLARDALFPADHLGYGWDLYRWTKDILSASDTPAPAAIGQARRNLNIYMKLSVDRPSPLHSCMLKIAWQLASDNHLDLPAFVSLWGLENLLPDDYDRFTTTEGKTFPALAEKVVQRAAKDAAAAGNTRAIAVLMPHLEAMMARYPDNVWFRQNLVKFLASLGRHDEAREQAILFARGKSQDFWAWDLLGDLQIDPDLRIACYCKGLLCPSEEDFVGRLRLKLARELSTQGHPSEARGEIETVLSHREKSGYRVPREAEELMAAPWYTRATAVSPSKKFYIQFATRAEEILFEDIEWINACVGESFTIEGEKRKTLRRLYISGKPMAREITVPERALRLKDLKSGQPIRIKADIGASISDRTKLYTAALRDDGVFHDTLHEITGVVDHVNFQKGVLHVIASREIEGVISLSDLNASVGDHIALRVARFSTRKGVRTRVVTAAPTDAELDETVCRRFRTTVRISNGMGFTDDGIFIPPDIVRCHDLQDDELVSGRAVINFNKRKSSWGWKAMTIEVL
ncbi:DUF7017 domain-containing protein [Hoeflea sp.]|uniref:tetratricopeptide repeat protein n=1 Tax=Hoeflea sp. TaxID=1940281 RepID=UPI003A94E6BE